MWTSRTVARYISSRGPKMYLMNGRDSTCTVMLLKSLCRN
ncbi:hypothetical protein X975_26793, partial [Stegodyphus mimosarum]